MTLSSNPTTRPTHESRVLLDTRVRLLAWSGGSTLVVLLALGLAIHVAVATSLAGAAEARLRERAAIMQSVVERLPPAAAVPVGPDRNEFIAGTPNEIGFVIGGPTSGTAAIVIRSDGTLPLGPDGQGALNSFGLPDHDGYQAALGGVTTIREVDVGGTPGRILSVPLAVAGETLVVQVFADRLAEEQTLATLRAVLAIGGLVVLGVAVFVGWIYAGRALVPIRLSLARQREFAADASHELRTPLAIVTSGVEELRRTAVAAGETHHPALDDIQAGASRLATIVDDLLFLARADSGALALEPAEIDLAETATDALADMAGMAGAAGVRLELAAQPSPIVGDARRLAQLTTILVDNAIRHGKANGVVEVEVRPVDGHAELIVGDDGPGIPATEIDHVFDRFWRARNAPSGGTGLGLAIAAWIVEGHGGTIRAGNRPGSGARFAVRIPSHLRA
ncbi:MAG: HAMP domain-containing histidine kinase [Chloroflexi bacterium]|nr:HAMP domain-containing histidine kinase [Chloroflexota bacterium]